MNSFFRDRIVLDLLITCCITVLAFIVVITLDLAEMLHELSWEINELILMPIVFSISLSILNLKRWRAEHVMNLKLQQQKLHMSSLLRLTKSLVVAHDFSLVVEAVSEEISQVTPYQQSWVYVEGKERGKVHLLAASQSSKAGKMILDECPVLSVKGDLMMEEIFSTMLPVIVEDARTDSRTNKDIVASLGNRTIINVPLIMMDNMIGAIGVGSFGDEGVIIPSVTDMKYLQAMASHVAVAVDRIRIDSFRKEAESKLSLLSEAIEQTGDTVIITDSHGEIEYVNPSFTRMSGYSSDEALGENPSLLKSGNQDKVFYQQLWQTINAGKVWRDEIINKRKDGTLYPALLTISPLRKHGEEITHFIATHSDLTKYHKLQEQFYQAQKMESLGIMLGGMSHDFNNILTIIMGKTQLAQLQNYDKLRMAELLQEVEELTKNAGEMIQHVLKFSRKREISIHPVNIGDIVQQTVNLAKGVLAGNVTLCVDTGDTPLLVNSDAVLFQQAILNLLINAKDALKTSVKPEINITLKMLDAEDSFYLRYPEKAGNPYLRLTIADNGCGICEEDRKNIFEAFFTTKSAEKGTGLGLSMVYDMVEAHKGKIEVNSEINKGTSFHLMLPTIVSAD